MTNKIIDQDSATHYTWGNHCDTWVLVNTPGLSVKQESMPGHTREQLHFHEQAQQFFFIMSGVATFHLGEETVEVPQLKGLLINPGEKHYIENATSNRLDYLLISQPATDKDRINVKAE